VTDARHAELAANLVVVRRTIADACDAAGRDPGEVTLVAVTKTFGEPDLRALAALGVTDLGENRANEFTGKAEAAADLDVTWHFVGQLQSNKARPVARYADVVHSVDRQSLVAALAKARAGAERPLRCLVQVALSDDAGRHQRGGVVPDRVEQVADLVAEAEGLELAGVMAVAPLGTDPDRAFAELAGVAERLRAVYTDATWVSAGMSDDLESAIRHGATHVRVGRALLGTRAVAG
jgi:pyridoxal phosphate enzyme (YggS family)